MAKSDKITISLTDFIDFVSKTGSTKQTQVKTIKNRDNYHPAKDYYKYIREGIINVHQNDGDKKSFQELLEKATDVKKAPNYEAAIKGYLKFLGRKIVEWIEPPHKHWLIAGLDVKVNPEVGLNIDGVDHYIKLYFKADKLSNTKASQIMNLLEVELRDEVSKEAVFAVLDVRQGKLFANEKKDSSLFPLLVGEAMSFQAIWDHLK